LAWAGADPVVAIARDDRADHRDQIGTITATRFQPLDDLPADTWSLNRPPNGYDNVDPHWKTIVDHSDRIWQGFCEWSYAADPTWCKYWVFARVSPQPVRVTRHDPTWDSPERPLPTIAPSPVVHYDLVKRPGQTLPGVVRPDFYNSVECTT